MERIAEEKGREVRTRCGCVCACVCYTPADMQACDLSAASCLSVIKTRCIHFEQGSQKEKSDEGIDAKKPIVEGTGRQIVFGVACTQAYNADR